MLSPNTVKIGACLLSGGALLFAVKKVVDVLQYYPFPGPRGGLFGIKLKGTTPDAVEELFLEHTDAAFSPVSMRVSGILVVLLGNETDIRSGYFRRRPDQVRRSPIFSIVLDAKPGSPGLFTAEDEEWKRQHRAYAPAFSAQNVEAMLPVICDKAARLINKFESQATVTDVVSNLKHCMSDIICEAALGLKFNFLERAEREDDQDLLAKLGNLLQLRFTDSARAIFRTVHLAIIAIYLPRWLSSRWNVIGTAMDRGEECSKLVDKLLRDKYAEIKKDPNCAKKKCLMDQALLHMMNSDGIDSWTEEQMLSVLNSNFSTFFIAGSETTAHTAAWLLYFLCAYPDWQRKCREQALELLNGRPWTCISNAELKQLTVLRACLYESIRLSPTVASMGGRVKVDDFTLRGQHIPKGSMVVALKRLATTVGSGLDEPLAFKPERWIDERTGNLKRESDVGVGVLVFGGGPRACPGRVMAETEVAVVTTAALVTFPTWRMLQDKDEVKCVDVLTVAPGPLSFRFEKTRPPHSATSGTCD